MTHTRPQTRSSSRRSVRGSATHRSRLRSTCGPRPSVIYAVADELRALGFQWFEPDEPATLDAFLREPDQSLLDHNRQVATRHFAFERLADGSSAFSTEQVGCP